MSLVKKEGKKSSSFLVSQATNILKTSVNYTPGMLMFSLEQKYVLGRPDLDLFYNLMSQRASVEH